MKRKFSHLQFKHQPHINAPQAIVDFENGYSASVIKVEELYQLAILKRDGVVFRAVYNTGITDDVLKHLSEEDVLQYLEKVELLK